VFFATDGNPGPNRFGPSPKAPKPIAPPAGYPAV
jgi:hypothetical protein